MWKRYSFMWKAFGLYDWKKKHKINGKPHKKEKFRSIVLKMTKGTSKWSNLERKEAKLEKEKRRYEVQSSVSNHAEK